MRKVYWRPRSLPRPALVVMAALSMLGLFGVERYRKMEQRPYYEEMQNAAREALKAMEEVRKARREMGPIDERADPAGSGLIGSLMTPVTSDAGFLAAKQTSINPNFAAVVVHMLKQAGVAPGDTVAVGCSGSFPALNICVSAAVETMGLRPIVITSASASQWGANDPGFLWLDMERLLYDRGVFSGRSVAVSLGGLNDTGGGLSEEGVRALEQGIRRSDLPMITAGSAEESIAQRMAIYAQRANGAPIKAYINVGGGVVSVGGAAGKRSFRAGLNLRRPSGKLADSVMTRFIEQGVPVIHLVQIEQLAQQYGLPLQPRNRPQPGEGGVYREHRYNRWLAGGLLIVILAGVYLLVRCTAVSRLFQPSSGQEGDSYQEPML